MLTSCKKKTSRSREDLSASKDSEFKSPSKKLDVEMTSPRNYMERYIRAIKNQASKGVNIQEFNSIEIGMDARNRVV